jgi:D-alanyl-D-alanine carboxypeptidase/D-alanyl-D-alanine-endopeptidase (penicillin-binding protein 4)
MPFGRYFPALSELSIPGYSGVLVESLEGNVVVESNADAAFNPASNVKIATAYAIIKTFGPDFRFMTNVYTDGAIDRTTGTLNGNLYVSGKDPILGFPHAVSIANELNRLGIRSITGDLIVTDNFAMNYSGSSLQSAQTLFNALDSSKRTPAATSTWLSYLANSGQAGKVLGIPGVTFTGTVYVQPIPSSLQLLFTHESPPVREILKATLCYSNNFLAERFGGHAWRAVRCCTDRAVKCRYSAGRVLNTNIERPWLQPCYAKCNDAAAENTQKRAGQV